MSLRDKMLKVASEAAVEAAASERGRILWIIEDELEQLRQQLAKKILIEQQRHLISVKIKIATAIYQQLKMRIARGDVPPTKEKSNGKEKEKPETAQDDFD